MSWKGRRVAIFGAHAFDAEVMAGGVAALAAAEGADVTLVHMTLGEKGHRHLSPEQYAQQKRAEAERAARVLGARCRCLGFEDAYVNADRSTAEAVAAVLREIKPDVVITHWRGSWHRDHCHTHTAVMEGIFYAGLPTMAGERGAHAVEQVLFAENWEDLTGFQPQIYIDVSSVFDVWWSALNEYALCREGLAGFPYGDFYRSLLRMRGCLSGVQYAEAFMTLPQHELLGMTMFAKAKTSL